MSEPELVQLRVQDGVAAVTLNRPERLNSMTADLLEQATRALETVAADPSIRAVVLTGAGRAFCAGGDLSRGAGGGVTDGVDPESRAGLLRRFMETSKLLHEMPAVTIAAINGACAGAGLSWACACDLRYASAKAKFNVAFLNAGLSGDFGGTWTLPRIIGYGRAREKYLVSEPFDAAEAERIGLVSRVFDADRLLPEVFGIAGKIATAAPLAVSRIKQNLVDSEFADFGRSLDLEARRHTECVESDDGREAARAFVEKRVPQFTGR
ncbi:enoyl-CoA hydratase [Saccharopolyspora sp. WRP15-2]|uniref:Enoyl-CoA hydratase n=1 Tax=Saccharopolyspora oryzae TaxID=2997343 RepID=A0ABT4UXC3_9PSEU|nr:enoyl-CoA hydratase [Saccharopolyspora oryzae]MDA3626351.1 enoyl-CoA hydratase [Saccharopolyspora oryzae]